MLPAVPPRFRTELPVRDALIAEPILMPAATFSAPLAIDLHTRAQNFGDATSNLPPQSHPELLSRHAPCSHRQTSRTPNRISEQENRAFPVCGQRLSEARLPLPVN